MDLTILAGFIDTVLNKPTVTAIIANPAQTGGDKPTAAASPNKPYCIYSIANEKETGLPIPEVESVSPSEVNQLMSTWNVASVELQFYSNDTVGEFSARNLAKYFITALGFQRSKVYQKDNGFGVMNIRPRVNADIVLGSLVERREIVEFTVNYVYTISDLDVPFFNEDGITITVNQEF